jgi:phosphatidylserine synthase
MTENFKSIYKDVKERNSYKLLDAMLAGHFCRPVSHICSTWFILNKVKPNTITLLMLTFGVVGSILFAMPNIFCKIVGYLFWYLWFTMDLSDGQVARYTKTFSKYGTEMDYMAHLIDHPFMNIAVWLTFLDMNIIHPILLSLLFMVNISIELVSRSVIAFNHYDKSDTQSVKPRTTNIFRYLLIEFGLYPTVIVCCSWIIVLDYALGNGFSFWLYCIWLAVYSFLMLRFYFRALLKFYKTN